MLKVFDTSSQKKEEFIPVEEGKVKMYACGPTVYDFCHLGHARSFIAFDVIRRYLEFKGFEVIYVQNFTDIDDKMINRANEEGITVFELAEKFINAYFEDIDALGIKKATYYPKATEFIPEMIELIKDLEEKGFAYNVDGDVYFDVMRFHEQRGYGKLSHVPLDKIESVEGIEIDEQKKYPADFALWKKRKENEPYWSSPWGDGRPGWHIECSIMSMKYLVKHWISMAEGVI